MGKNTRKKNSLRSNDMVKFFALVLFMEAMSWAVVVKPPFSKKDILVNILSPSNTSTSKVLSTMPIVIDGRYMCPYIGSVYGPMEKDFVCADAYVYHLVRVAANTKKSLDCYYDYNLLSGDHTLSVLQQKECPDILVSYAGYKFLAAVYFDEIDDYRLYFFDMDVPKQVFQGDLDNFPKVQSQIRYRRTHMGREKTKNEIIF
ncbi:hypothetical protein [Fibrobacter sp. UWB16]|uniref:hypothetical protein n=1 Tax=Fibrobacter sp. UWB16 TaxID=1945874 RepID=UPI000BE47C71|nr:hypothetical protein [Fibrobacter sp. UWB16]